MRLLLDTHTFLWLVEGSPNLSPAAKAAFADPANQLFLSAASVWELAIKIGNRKLSLADPLDIFITRWTAAYQLDPLSVQFAHAHTVARLALHHKDPFDRLLIAQAMVEGMSVATSDSKFAPYGVPLVW
jgi:PIN domain nuclease of toxin-antitoxin system